MKKPITAVGYLSYCRWFDFVFYFGYVAWNVHILFRKVVPIPWSHSQLTSTFFSPHDPFIEICLPVTTDHVVVYMFSPTAEAECISTQLLGIGGGGGKCHVNVLLVDFFSWTFCWQHFIGTERTFLIQHNWVRDRGEQINTEGQIKIKNNQLEYHHPLRILCRNVWF